MKKLVSLLILLCFVLTLFGQEQNNRKINEEELITISRETNLVAALKAIEYLSVDFAGKNILNTSNFNQPIGISVNQLHWYEALMLITGYHSLLLEERPGVYLIRDVEIAKKEDTTDQELVITPNSQQVRISAIFFKADRSLSKEVGINWHTLIDGNIHVNLSGADDMGDEIIAASIDESMPEIFDIGNVTVALDALLKIVESYQRGAVVARPTITVVSGKKGFVQVGQDFSIKTFDQAGNVIDKFYETGMILTVTPKILTENENQAIHLMMEIEKSSAIPGALTTIINKSKSSTDVLLYDGEETVIGGLYDNDTKFERSGVPILKDLPWWVFGLRYIFGRTSKAISSNEMIIILKVDIVDKISERKLSSPTVEEQIKEGRIENTQADELFEEDRK